MLRPLDANGVYNSWDWIRKGVQKSIDKTGSHMRPEDVYVRLRNGTAWLYLICPVDEEIGFMVLTQEHDPDGMVMFIWVLWAEPGKLSPHYEEFKNALDQLARNIKAKRVRGSSPRRGYLGYGYAKPVATIYEKEIED